MARIKKCVRRARPDFHLSLLKTKVAAGRTEDDKKPPFNEPPTPTTKKRYFSKSRYRLIDPAPLARIVAMLSNGMTWKKDAFLLVQEVAEARIISR